MTSPTKGFVPAGQAAEPYPGPWPDRRDPRDMAVPTRPAARTGPGAPGKLVTSGTSGTTVR